MSVRLYYENTWRNGYRWALVGPDKDGRIKLPPSKTNLFERNGSAGSAPLYHQTRRAKYAYSGSDRYVTNYDYLKVNDYWSAWYKLAYVARDTWKKVARVANDEVECTYYYSKGGTRYTEQWVSVRKQDIQDAIKIIQTEDNLESQVDRAFHLIAEEGFQRSYSKTTGWDISAGVESVEVSVLRSGDVSRKYHDFWELATETGVVNPPPDLRLALSKASEDLAASLPQTPINIAEALIDLVSVKNISNAFRTSEKVSAMLADSWLKWRYVYTTTKLDVRSMREFLNRGLSLFDNVHKKDYSCHGYARMGNLTCRCSTNLQGRELKEQFRRASQSLHSYDLWDLVPWSFVVDWFIPIGSMLQNLEYQNNLLKLDHGTIWYTCEWYEDSASENFMRFCTNHFVTTPCSIICDKGPTNKTIAMRCIDAMALLIGR